MERGLDLSLVPFKVVPSELGFEDLEVMVCDRVEVVLLVDVEVVIGLGVLSRGDVLSEQKHNPFDQGGLDHPLRQGFLLQVQPPHQLNKRFLTLIRT